MSAVQSGGSAPAPNGYGPSVRILLSLVLAVVAAAQAYGVLAVRRHFVFTEDGQRLDWIAISGNSIGADRIDELVYTVLDGVTITTVVGATVVVFFVALMRRRFLLATAAVGLVAGANLTTQWIKHGTDRPNLGIDPERFGAGNSLPSGHTTIAASIAVALVLVLPSRVRPFAAVAGAVYAAVAAVATMSAGWHRPSDAVAAVLVVGAWAVAVGAVLVLLQPGDAEPVTHGRTALGLAAVAVVAFAVAAVALLWVGDGLAAEPDQLARRELFAVYAGAAAVIAGTCAAVMALLLAMVHRIVPDAGTPL